MKRTLHRSENLLIAALKDQIEFEIRFSTSAARGTCDARCPRCGEPGEPAHWELEGPDTRGNTVWMNCARATGCPGNEDGGFTWTQPVVFEPWVEKEE
ncbi:MAG: hypothetical protein EA398_13250 [Deltaproteobacteria bacterium]|nr:MAG: hypothetical protein EA398_13250 [Deltaproteobacteria bacterium]